MYISDEDINCCFISGNNRFRYRVGAIVIEDGCVLLATNDTADYYYSIGGGVHLGELAEDAVKREVKEETGVDYDIDRLFAVHENMFKPSNGVCAGLDCHELSLYFLMKPRGTREINSDSYCPDGKEYVEWVPLDKLKDVKVFPEFYKDELMKAKDDSKRILHVITK